MPVPWNPTLNLRMSPSGVFQRLQFDEVAVGTIHALHQLFVAAGFHNLPLIHIVDLVRMADNELDQYLQMVTFLHANSGFCVSALNIFTISSRGSTVE